MNEQSWKYQKSNYSSQDAYSASGDSWKQADKMKQAENKMEIPPSAKVTLYGDGSEEMACNCQPQSDDELRPVENEKEYKHPFARIIADALYFTILILMFGWLVFSGCAKVIHGVRGI